MVLVDVDVLVELQRALRDGVPHTFIVAVVVSYEYRVRKRAQTSLDIFLARFIVVVRVDINDLGLDAFVL